MSDLNKTLADRQKTHGDFQQVAKVAESLMGGIEFQRLSASQSFAVRMIVGKLARIVCGNPNEPDHWHDIAGYARLVEDELIGDKRESNDFDFTYHKISSALHLIKNNLANRYPKIDIVAGNCLHIVINANPRVDKPSFDKEVVAIVLDVELECRCVGLECLDVHVNQRQSSEPPIAVFVFEELNK